MALPESGKWHIKNQFFSTPPFQYFEMDFVQKTGSVLVYTATYPFSQLVVHANSGDFLAKYTVRSKHGVMEGKYQKDQSFQVEFYGGTDDGTFSAYAVNVSDSATTVYMSSDTTYKQIDQGMEIHGAIFVGAGMPSILRIPIPGTNGLAVELTPRGFVPKGGSTSTLFFQSIDGKRHL